MTATTHPNRADLRQRAERGTCPACGESLWRSRRRGPVQVYCSHGCRAHFHKAARVWALKAVERGAVSVDAVLASIEPYTANSEGVTLRRAPNPPEIDQRAPEQRAL